MLQSIRIEPCKPDKIPALGIVCLWSTLGLLLTEAIFTRGFGADLVQALLMAG